MRVLLVLGLLLSFFAQTSTQVGNAQQAREGPAQTSDQSPAGKLVLSNVTVMTKEGNVTGLGKDAFNVLDNKRPREITYFSHEDEPLSIAVLLDLSVSMSEGTRTSSNRKRLLWFRDYFSQFIQASNPANEYLVISFSDQPQLLLQGANGEQALSAVSSLLSSTKPKGDTALYDACHFGIEKVTQGRYLKQAILLFSDGEDTVSKHSSSDLRRLVKENAVMFFSIVTPGPSTFHAREAYALLDDLARITGGEAYFSRDAKKLIAALNITATMLRSQYTLGITPESNAAGDKWHSLKVEVKLPRHSPVKQKDVWVRSRAGYYSAQ